METKLTESQSLSLIGEMIVQARNNFQKGAGNVFIFSGITVSLVALLNVALLFILSNPNQSFMVWWLMAPMWFINRILNRKRDRSALVRTHIDSIISTTWYAYCISVVSFLCAVFGYAIAGEDWHICVLITPVLLIMTGMAEFVTARACRFKPLQTGACIMWGGALCCLATYVLWREWSGIAHFLVLAACMISGFVLPGYKLNKPAKDHV
jgi:hypothetical protein